MRRRALLAVLPALFGVLLAALPAWAASAAPARYRIAFQTSRGSFTVDIVRAQAPHGADRLFELIQHHVFDGARFYRVVPGFVVQWGYAADPAVSRTWTTTIPDDPVKTSNVRGTLSFAATSEPNTRSSQLFINYANNARLDGLGFAPVGKVARGMDVVDRIYSGYGGDPDQGQIATSGNAYLTREYPKLDYIKSARIVR